MNNVRKNVDNLLKKPMDRRGFLKHVGLGALLVVGLGPILKMLTSPQKTSNSVTPANGYGYGPMPYGSKVSSSATTSTRSVAR